MAPSAVLSGLILIVSFCMSHSVVEVEGTDWLEPVLLWIAICMPTGMGKSSLYKFLRKIIREAQALCKLENTTSWLSDDQSFEKMGDLMFHNHWKLLGLYDELPMLFFLINILKAVDLLTHMNYRYFYSYMVGNNGLEGQVCALTLSTNNLW